MPTLSKLLAALLLVLISAAAFAAQQVPPDCSDDRGVDRCSPEQHRRVPELYGLNPIEDHARRGDQVRRAFYVDGYGRDLLAISFVRSAGRDPRVMLHIPKVSGDAVVEPSEALVPEPIWDRVLARGAHFDRALTPRSGADEKSICLHSWVSTIEAADGVPNQGRTAAVRRETEDACENGLGWAYASDLADFAVDLFPYCSALERSQRRNSETLLRTCATLKGDRLAAAKAHNQLFKLNQLSNPVLAAGSLNAFHYRATLEWAGEEIGGDQHAAAKAWIERMSGKPSSDVFIRSLSGERSDRVRVQGELTRSVDATGQKAIRQRAPLTLIFTQKRPGSVFQIERAIVGAFTPAPLN